MKKHQYKSTILTEDLIQEYLDELRSQGLSKITIHSYRRYLMRLFETLPDDKRFSRDTLLTLQNRLHNDGYRPCTINVYTSAINGFLNYLDRRDLQIHPVESGSVGSCPSLTRTEYLRLLSAARVLGRERAYLLIKVFGCLGLTLKDLPHLTAEAVTKGYIAPLTEKDRKSVDIPVGLRKELQDYSKRSGIFSGPIFKTRNGKPIDRSNVTISIQSLSYDARVSTEKCNPRCLRKLYHSTQESIQSNIYSLVDQAYNQLLEQEQLTTGWNV